MSSSRALSRSGMAVSAASMSRPISACFCSTRRRRRNRSMARFFAVAMSQAAGLSGIPVSGQRSSATARASWASSSASPTSRTTRASPAISFANSIRQMASMV